LTWLELPATVCRRVVGEWRVREEDRLLSGP
jgi:hypothetical protein